MGRRVGTHDDVAMVAIYPQERRFGVEAAQPALRKKGRRLGGAAPGGKKEEGGRGEKKEG